jgi:predicted DNA-binding transcriptional regulator AlpA
MSDLLLQEVNERFPEKAFLTLSEVAQFLDCSENVIYNWTKRSDPKRRPPRIIVGKTLRFPKRDLVRWLVEELSSNVG